jgi:hypothetical protein
MHMVYALDHIASRYGSVSVSFEIGNEFFVFHKSGEFLE